MKRNSSTPKWTQESLNNAIEEIKQGAGKRKAAEKYGIPWGTLSDKLSGRRKLQTAHTTILNPDEEEEVALWIRKMSERGFVRTREEIMKAVKEMLDFRGRNTIWKDNKPSEKWFTLFRKRHNLLFRKPQKLGIQRALITPQQVNKWFSDFTDTLKKIDPTILLDPKRIFNTHDSGFILDATSGMVLTCLGSKYVFQIGSETISALVCASAADQYIWPMLIYPGTQFCGFQPRDVFPESFIATSENGRINQTLFAEWLENAFVPQTQHLKKPILLLVNGHASHQSVRVSQICQDHGIVLYCLLAHASHLIQPLDVGLFKSMKREWENAVKSFTVNEQNIVTKRNFAKVFKQAYEATVEKKLASKAFMKSGIFPLDPSSIAWEKVLPSASPSEKNQTAEPRSSSPTFDHIVQNHLMQLVSLAEPIQTPEPRSQSIGRPSPNPLESFTCSENANVTDNMPVFTSTGISSTRTSSDKITCDSSSCEGTSSNTQNSRVSTLRKFSMICAQIGEAKLNLFFTRLEEGYDVQEDHLFSTWKHYHEQITASPCACSNGEKF